MAPGNTASVILQDMLQALARSPQPVAVHHCMVPRGTSIRHGWRCAPRSSADTLRTAFLPETTPSHPSASDGCQRRQAVAVGTEFLFESTPAAYTSDGQTARVHTSMRRTDKFFTAFEMHFPDSDLEPSTMFSAEFRTKFHNWFLDKGMKFMVNYQSPLIKKTDLFDLLSFGCYDKLRDKTKSQLMGKLENWKECTLQGRCGKDWYKHPEIAFGANLRKIAVKLQDLTSGDIRWDAVYSTSGGSLKSDDLPIGGSHPFFVPDWCPAPGDFLAHRFRLTVENLDGEYRPHLPRIAEMLFTMYGPAQLANSYQWENNDPSGYSMPQVPDGSCFEPDQGDYESKEPCSPTGLRQCTMRDEDVAGGMQALMRAQRKSHEAALHACLQEHDVTKCFDPRTLSDSGAQNEPETRSDNWLTKLFAS